MLHTPHGEVQTPAFMPVGTQGVVKALRHDDLESVGAEIILGNTYHLYLRPGHQRIASLGGLHKFIGWHRPILTDSGGYQVFSLADRRTLTEEGAAFSSHLDGSSHLLTPEKAVDIQASLGADIAMAFDECLAFPATHEATAQSMRRSARWADRCRRRLDELRRGQDMGVHSTNPEQALFGIVQGGVYPDLRRESVERTVELEFDGYAIGGLSVGEPNALMYDITDATTRFLPATQPRYLMGTGTPVDIVESVARGVDMFDCVMPTRHARNGQLFTTQGRINIRNAKYADDERPLDATCACLACRRHSRAYLRHLFMAGEMTASTLNTLHNLTFYLDTMKRIRDAIAFRDFERFRQAFVHAAAPACD